MFLQSDAVMDGAEPTAFTRRAVGRALVGTGMMWLGVNVATGQGGQMMLKGEWYGEPWSFSTVFKVHFVFRTDNTYDYDVKVGDRILAAHSGRYEITKDRVEAGHQMYKLGLKVTRVLTEPSPQTANRAMERSILLNGDSTYLFYFSNGTRDYVSVCDGRMSVLWGLKLQS